MMRRIRVLLCRLNFPSFLALVLSAAVLASCGGDGQSEADTADVGVDDTASEVDAGPATLRVTSPDGGLVYVGGNLEVAWESENLGGDVAVELLDGSDVVEVIDEEIPADSGMLTWPVPVDYEPGVEYRIQVRSLAQEDRVDVSDDPFEIALGSLTVTSPEGGTYGLGANIDVTWDYEGALDAMDILLVDSEGGSEELASGVENTGVWNWSVSSGLAEGEYTIVVQATRRPEVMAESEPFTLARYTLQLTSPNGGEVIPLDTTWPIEWTSTGDFAAVDIELLQGAEPPVLLAEATENDGGFEWVVAGDRTASNDYVVRISATNLVDVRDTSDAPFALSDASLVVDSVTPTPAAPGEPVTVGWTSAGPVENVGLELLKGGAAVSELAASVPDTGQAVVDLPEALLYGEDYSIRVMDNASGVSAESEHFIVSGWQYRYPMTIEFDLQADEARPVPLHLTAQEFDFGRTMTNGEDIRLDMDGDISDGFDTPHWIEQWGTDEARVWGRMELKSADSPIHQVWVYVAADGVSSTSSFSDVFHTVERITSDRGLGQINYDVEAFIIEAGATATIQEEAVTSVTANYISIEGVLDGNGAGYRDSSTPQGGGPGGGTRELGSDGGGGGYGGAGGDASITISADWEGLGGAEYGTPDSLTIDMGSEGGQSWGETPGGGAVSLTADVVKIQGAVLMDGVPGTSGCTRCQGGGSGGGVLVTTGAAAVQGMISVRGGDGAVGYRDSDGGGGGGAGGRIKIFARDLVADALANYVLSGGTATATPLAGPAEPGENGTLHKGTPPTNSGVSWPAVFPGPAEVLSAP